MKNKINEEKIITVLFLSIIFSMFIMTMKNNYEEIKNNIINILQNSEKTKYERILELAQKSDNIFNENVVFKSNYIDLYGLTQKIIRKNYIQDSTDRTRDVIKTKDGMLTFVQEKEDMAQKAENIAILNEKMKEYNIPLIYIQAPYKVRKNEDLPVGVVDYANKNADMLLAELKKDKINILDLREIFINKNIKDEYFVTDHHWKIKTAFEACNYITEILNKKYEFNIDDFYTNIENYECINKEKCFLGSIGKRIGKYYGGVDDFEYILPKFTTDLKLTKNNTEIEGSFEDTIIVEELIDNEDIISNRYACYFGRDYAELKIKNNNILSNKKVLLIQDSYGLPVSAMLILRVKELRTLDLRHFEGKEIEYIKEYNPDIVLIMYNPSSFYIEEIFDFQ